MLNQEGPYVEKRSNPLFQRLRTLGKGVGGIPGKRITIYTAKGRAVETVAQQNFFLFPLSLFGEWGPTKHCLECPQVLFTGLRDGPVFILLEFSTWAFKNTGDCLQAAELGFTALGMNMHGGEPQMCKGGFSGHAGSQAHTEGLLRT